MPQDRLLVPDPDLGSFSRFMSALHGSFPEKSYRWTAAKERSCDWLVERIPTGTTGVDVGGTEYLCEKLAAKGCAVTYYDFVPPRSFPTFVQDDMFNVLRHFQPGSLDFITTRHTLEHSFVPLFQLWAYNQLLTEDGQLLVIVPAYHDRWVWMTTHFHCVPPDSWHMLFHRAGFSVKEFEVGTWKPRKPEFVEHRFVLGVESRDLRLVGRPDTMVMSEPGAIPAGRAMTMTQSDAAAEEDDGSAQTGAARMHGPRRWWRGR
jgi:SAM-dependent methyltransferase